jgi:hypothetical protein
VGGPFLDLDLTFRRGDSEVVGLLLHSWQSGGEGGAALLYTWETATLQVGQQGGGGGGGGAWEAGTPLPSRLPADLYAAAWQRLAAGG